METDARFPEQRLLEDFTQTLVGMGLTEQQLCDLHFWSKNNDRPVEQWSTTFFEGMPLEAISYVTPYCALKYLNDQTLFDPNTSRELWAVVNDFIMIQLAQNALRFKEAQRQKSQKPRGKVSEDGETLKRIVASLVARPERKDDSPGELWRHFFSELDDRVLSPKEIQHTADPRKDFYEYTTHHGVKTIRRARFYNLVSEIKKSSRQPG
jgi:hypothetical protein